MTQPGEGTSSGDPRLRELVLEVLERLDRSGPDALEQACCEHPELADALRARVATLAELGLVAADLSGELPERIGDFRLIEEVGAGGMGVVFRAEQISLGRQVALKLIRPDALLRSDTRERFARETTIIARMQHPGIVPIHTVGGEDELPYYAMEFVQGCTLAEVLVELSGQSPDRLDGADLWRAIRARTRGESQGDSSAAGGPLFEGSWEQACLRVGEQVADALQHAHERGVLHRDLKPSNVMVTTEGRVMLLDFGLSVTEGAESMTGTTDRIGSLPYMPPELLRDGPRVLDRRSDVYALGVTLYQLLTLHPPFPGASVPDVMARILEGRPPRLRAHHPGISWESETVCLAAMERDPARRYADAEDLARDLSNALHHRLVEARRAGFALRVRRWVQRRPGEAAAIALLLLLPIVASALLAREARTTGAALQVAEANHDRAVRAIDAMLFRLGDEGLAHVPGMLELRREFIGAAADLYAELVEERPDDVEMALLAGRCELLQVDLCLDEQRVTEAEELVLRALERLEPWSAETSPAVRYLRARLLASAATVAREQEQHEEADQLLKASIEIARELLRDHPEHEATKPFLLHSLSVLATRERSAGGSVGGLNALRQSVQGLRELDQIQPDQQTRTALADALSRLAYWLDQEGQATQAADALIEELALRQALLDRDPRDEEARLEVATSASNLAGRLIVLGRHEEALEFLDIAGGELRIVRSDFPGIARFELAAADLHLNRGAALGRLERDADAALELGLAIELLAGLCDAHPTNAEYQRTLGTSLVNLASMEVDLGDPDGALETCERGREWLERALRARPGSPDWRKWLGIEADVHAKVLLALGRPGDAADALIRTAEFAAHRADILRNGLGRLLQCLDQARIGGDEGQYELCQLAAREFLARVTEGGLLDGDDKYLSLQARLGGGF